MTVKINFPTYNKTNTCNITAGKPRGFIKRSNKRFHKFTNIRLSHGKSSN